jgi:GntR family transcriptional regulator
MPEPMYRLIADDLQRKIETGVLGPGDQLPTEIELRDEYQASRNTVRDAVRWLIGRGLVETRPGQGTFVVEKIDPFVTALSTGVDSGFGGESAAYASEVAASRRTPTVTDPRVEIQRADGVVASELGLGPGSTVVSRHQQRYIDGTPWSLQTSFYPMRFVERGATHLIQAQNIVTGVMRYLEEQLSIKQVGWSDKITVRPPDQNEAAFFKLPEDGRVAVFEIFETGFDEQGQPIRLTVSIYPTDRNQFAVYVGEVPAEVVLSGGLDDAGAKTTSSAATAPDSPG